MTRPDTSMPRTPAQEIAQLRSQVAQYRNALREVDHRTSNSLQIAASLIKMQQRGVVNEEARGILETASARIEAIARSHRQFHEHPVAEGVDLSRALTDLVAELSVSTGLDCRAEVQGSVVIPSDMSTPLMVVVNELVMNARKHAFDGRDGYGIGGTVRIALRVTPEGTIELCVADDGCGLPDGFDPTRTPGLGMKVVQATVRQLGGTISAESDGGARFTLTVPLA